MVCSPCRNQLHGLCAQRINRVEGAGPNPDISIREPPEVTWCDCQHDTSGSALNMTLLTATEKPDILVP